VDISRPGVFAFLDSMDGGKCADFARKVQRLGYSTLWIVEGSGRNSLVFAAWLLARTDTLIVGTGVASIWARAATTMASGARTAAELSGGRFILGVGANNPVSAARRGLSYDKPVTFMGDYLEKMKVAAYEAPAPRSEPPVVLAALNPRMLMLSGTDAQGTLTYFVPPEHTRKSREMVGPSKWVCAEQAVILDTDAARARAAARNYMKTYLKIPAYVKNLRRFGFSDLDFADGGSDRLVDAIVAWGDERKLRERIDSHYQAGATHVCVLALSPAGGTAPDVGALEALSPG
jgi:probable F420-dependent oxidoreductase